MKLTWCLPFVLLGVLHCSSEPTSSGDDDADDDIGSSSSGQPAPVAVTGGDAVCCVEGAHYECGYDNVRDECRNGTAEAIDKCEEQSNGVGCGGADPGGTCSKGADCAPVSCECEDGLVRVGPACEAKKCGSVEDACAFGCAGNGAWSGEYYVVKQ